MKQRAWKEAVPRETSREKSWADAVSAGNMRFKLSMHDFHDAEAAIGVALGAARQHMLRLGFQPVEFSGDLTTFERSLHALRG